MVLPEPDEERFVNIASICAALNLQDANEIVWLMPVQAADASEVHPVTNVAMFAADEIAARANAGNDAREVQPENMVLAFVTADMLNCGTVTSDEQPINMLLMFSTEAVLNCGTVASELQF